MQENIYDVAVIGGGAAGLAAAITAAKHSKKVIIAERNQRVGKKILTTGNGRCNIGNAGELNGRYHGDAEFALNVLNKVTPEMCREFFSEIGIPFTEQEDKKLFPMSLQAGSVVDALRFAAEKYGVHTLTETQIIKNEKQNGGFLLTGSRNEKIKSKTVIVACGGMAAPKTGSDGNGYNLLKQFGHSITRLYPAIVQLTTEKEPIKPLKGIKLDAEIKTEVKGNKMIEYGEVLFTDYGISGPPVMQLGRYADEMKTSGITLDLVPKLSFAELYELAENACKNRPQRPAAELFMGILHSRLGQTIVKQSLNDSTARPMSELSDEELKKAVSRAKNFRLKVTGTLGWDNAQVTAGGAKASEFDEKTMESKICPGLYAAGEVVDVDGDCGGFNLQWAWSSGLLAGESASQK